MKLHFKLLVKLLSSIVLLLSITACGPNPQDDIPLFKSYIEENINKKSDDPYISSSVKPGDDLYEYLKKLQQGAGDERLLEPLIKAGNTDAMVWMARTNSNDLEMRAEVLGLLYQAMQAGNPFAALALSNGGEECWLFGKGSLSSRVGQSIGEEIPTGIGTCSEENWLTAQKGFKELAENGDLRAQYYLLKRQHIDDPEETRESRDHHVNEVIRFAEEYYYQPLMDYVETILVKETPSSQLKAESEELELLSVNLLTIAANHNYIPAINKLLEFEKTKIEPTNPLFKQGISLGSPRTIRWRTYLDYKKRYIFSPEEEYFYSHVYNYLTEGFGIFDRVELDKNTKEKVDKKINRTLSGINSMVYIDAFTLRSNWVDENS
ncbi:hypothetical protein ACRZ5S_07535 [Vibrio scophthalmi]|uniref:hypothetical protein n=1 Tax=Vibrio scophthalmi TaxID=45658 RepID=UPI003EC0C669